MLTISNITETETDSDFTVQATVTLSTEVEGGFDVAYSSALGTAEATDVTVLGSSLSFAGTAGETQTIDVVIVGDDIVEDDETFTITLGDVTGTSAVQDAGITTDAVSDGLIIDDDVVDATLSIDDVSQIEDGTFTFTITSDTAAERRHDGGREHSRDRRPGGTAGSDYTAIVNQTATIAAGSTSTTVTVTVNDDAIVEDNQTFEVNISDAKIGGVTDSNAGRDWRRRGHRYD